ncbi:hypothetical protein Drorol1_Dr00015276, partial [Drosera rotundifolia]
DKVNSDQRGALTKSYCSLHPAQAVTIPGFVFIRHHQPRRHPCLPSPDLSPPAATTIVCPVINHSTSLALEPPPRQLPSSTIRVRFLCGSFPRKLPRSDPRLPQAMQRDDAEERVCRIMPASGRGGLGRGDEVVELGRAQPTSSSLFRISRTASCSLWVGLLLYVGSSRGANSLRV